MTSLRRTWQKMACWLTRDDAPQATPIKLPHPSTLSGLYNDCDHIEEVLRTYPAHTSEAQDARRESLWLAQQLAVTNTPVAMHMLKLTLTSTSIWGDHNQLIIDTAHEIGQRTVRQHPSVAAQFDALVTQLTHPNTQRKTPTTHAAYQNKGPYELSSSG
jgi:hypothetical protein